MRILLVGPGALGCLLATKLLTSNKAGSHTIALLDYNRNRAEHISKNGLFYESNEKTIHSRIETFSTPSAAGRADVVFLCVKSYDVRDTLQYCAPLFGDGTLLIFMQNGMSHLDPDLIPDRVIAVFATTTEGATSLGQGHVYHAGAGITYLGFLQSQAGQPVTILETIVDLLTTGGMDAHYSSSIYQRMWTKLIINVGINAMTVIYNCKNGELLGIPAARQQMAAAVAEAAEVSRAEGISIPAALEKVFDVCRSTAGNVSSMLQDIRLGRRTEIEAINGRIVLLAEKHSITVPMNSFFVDQVRSIEAQHLKKNGDTA